MLEIFFDKGTLVAQHYNCEFNKYFAFFKWDERIQSYRAPAIFYREFVLSLREKKIPYIDKAKSFLPSEFPISVPITPRIYQNEAISSWIAKGSRGVIVLPTGAGKTILAVLAISQIQRPTLIHVPTLDLMNQWRQILEKFFQRPIGQIGGGIFIEESITVATYDSALIHVSNQGNKFGFIIFDECHHLPSDQMQYTAISSLAPFRLGLTATPERSDGKEKRLYELCGSLCYEVGIKELEGFTLSPYDVVTIEVEMSQIEKTQYEESRKIYLSFLKENNINFNQKGAWHRFLWLASKKTNGREAFLSYLKQKKLSQSSENKFLYVWDLICKHKNDRIIIFTQDNESAYHIGRKFLLPVISHHTKTKERELFLNSFREGSYKILVTSKVLNEGVDVPDANVAIVVSGSGTVREHVQRLGRILRAKEGKKAVLYELISAGTGEYFVNQRRRMHSAYEKGTSEL
ncbi:DEAD/DEAH box helicase [Silvanigrella aquatica]|uniref:DNA 3'-5' helicase n=1 Tax=Silvanigrella aquatica TaxID=1915309 RepID=A0A1L4D0P0_9BACT|nr:DEAD/DEAH box helicase family protein [Silvanigrella aquatica]APJ03754.1 heavy metal transporter [Silvanigrella aquatica]